MALRWEDERYVRVYTRDTVPWLALSWQARALFLFILRKVDRAGLLELSGYGTNGIAVIVGMPHDVVADAIHELETDGCVEIKSDTLIVRNFIEAQESISTPASRQRDSRERKRDMVRRGLQPQQRGCVIYFIQSEHGGPIKIGQTQDVAHRLVQLQTSRPDKLVILAAAPGTLEQERLIHDHFAHVREKGEWFSAIPELVEYTRSVKSTNAIACDWSQFVTGHSVPSDPSLAEPSRADIPPTEGPPKTKPRKPIEPKPERPRWHEVLAAYSDGWKALHSKDGKPPKIDGADISALARLYDDNGADETITLVKRFVSDSDPHMCRRGHLLRDLPSRINAYRSKSTEAGTRNQLPLSTSVDQKTKFPW